MSFKDDKFRLEQVLNNLTILINSAFYDNVILSMDYSNYYDEEIVLVDFVDGEHIHIDVTDKDLITTVTEESFQRLSTKGYNW